MLAQLMGRMGLVKGLWGFVEHEVRWNRDPNRHPQAHSEIMEPKCTGKYGELNGLSDLFFSFLAVPGFELRIYTLSHSISPFILMGFSR
jgi:hypothetical protein